MSLGKITEVGESFMTVKHNFQHTGKTSPCNVCCITKFKFILFSVTSILVLSPFKEICSDTIFGTSKMFVLFNFFSLYF